MSRWRYFVGGEGWLWPVVKCLGYRVCVAVFNLGGVKRFVLIVSC